MQIITPARLANLRKEARLSQQALAVRIGISLSTIQRWESPRRAPVTIATIIWRAVQQALELPDDAAWSRDDGEDGRGR